MKRTSILSILLVACFAIVGCEKPGEVEKVAKDTTTKKPKETQKEQTQPGPKVGELAPEISGVDLDGEAFRLSEYRGKVVLLDFWGDW